MPSRHVEQTNWSREQWGVVTDSADFVGAWRDRLHAIARNRPDVASIVVRSADGTALMGFVPDRKEIV
jgi:hypothetical protein